MVFDTINIGLSPIATTKPTFTYVLVGFSIYKHSENQNC